MSGLNAIVDVISLRNAITAMGRVAPNRHFPHVRLDVQEDTATLSVAVPSARLCVPVPFVRASVAGSVMLPTDRLGSLLKLTQGETADVELMEGPIVRIRTSEPRSGLSATYNLATIETSAEESTGPVFADDASLWILPCDDLQRALERVRHAIGDSSRYSLGGALIEIDGSRVALVATDTRRLAHQEFCAHLIGPGSLPFGPESRGETYRPILPESVFKALSGLLKSHGGPDVGLSFAEAPAVNPKIDHEPTRWARFTFGGEGAELIVRLADGKFPKWEQVRPDEHALDSSATLNPTDLMRAVTCAKVGTTDDAPGIRLESIGLGDASALRLSAGETMAESYADVHRGAFGITLAARYLGDALKALGKTSQPLVIRATAAQTETGEAIPAILETADGFLGLICPITAEPKSVPEPEPTAEEIGAAEMATHWPLSLEPGDVAVWTGIRSGEGSTGRWHVVGPHPDGPGLYVARPETAWGALGEETCIDPRGPEWSLQVSADDDDSDPEPEPEPSALGWHARNPDTFASPPVWEIRPGVWEPTTPYWVPNPIPTQDPEPAPESDPQPPRNPDPEPLNVAPESSNPAPLVGNPLLQAIIDTPIPRPRRADLRREPRKEWAREVRKLLKSLGLSGISVRALRYSQASSIDVTLPGQVAHETSPMRGHDFATCPLCRQEHAAERHVERLIVGAFPDLDDRSDYRDDHFDAPLSIHTGSPIPVASDPEPLPVAYPGIGYPAPAVIYPLQPIILLDDPEPISPDPEPEPLPVASVRGIPVTFGRSVPRVAPEPMERTRNGVTLREPEPIGHPDNTTVADAGAPAIGQAALVIECHGHTEPLSQESTSSIPSDPPSDPEPITVSRVAPEPLIDPEPSRYTRRVAHGLTLAESIDHEADRLEARCNGAGRLMARALRELAESVRWSGATTPDEHEARMELWNEWAVDNEPQESVPSY